MQQGKREDHWSLSDQGREKVIFNERSDDLLYESKIGFQHNLSGWCCVTFNELLLWWPVCDPAFIWFLQNESLIVTLYSADHSNTQ